MEDYLAIGDNGISANYFNGDTIAGVPFQQENIARIAFDGESESLPKNELNPASNISGSWKFYIEAPTNENYNLYLDTDSFAVKLWIDGKEILMNKSQTGTVWDNTSEISFTAGTWHEVEIQAIGLHDTATLKWQRNGQLIEPIVPSQTFPYTNVENFLSSYIKLLKAIRIIEGLKITREELEYLAAETDLKFPNNTFFETLPTSSEGINNTTVEGFMQRLVLFLEYTTLKV